MALRLTAALSSFWLHQRMLNEARRWISHALARGDAGSAQARAKLLGAAAALEFHEGDMAFDRGEYPRATALFQEALALARRYNDQDAFSWALITLARVARAERDFARAIGLYEERLPDSSNREMRLLFVRSMRWGM